MDLQTAMNILEIDTYENISLEYLKKRYHKLALQNHPDKCGNTIVSKVKFQQINEAYEVLKREISIINNGVDDQTNGSLNTGYMTILHLFIDGILKGKYNEFISNMIKDIVGGCKEISLKLFEDMDKDTCLMVYNIMLKYKVVLHISDEILEKVMNIILEKFKDVNIFILNPSLNDILSNNVYKLEVNKNIYFVPLWHSEVYFDNIDGGDIIVKCIPELPDNMTIDENNNLHITIKLSFTYSLFDDSCIHIKLGSKGLDIPIDKLYIKKSQTYYFRKSGVSQILDSDIYNVDSKGDIIVKIIFEE
jgi:hypothetical protein